MLHQKIINILIITIKIEISRIQEKPLSFLKGFL